MTESYESPASSRAAPTNTDRVGVVPRIWRFFFEVNEPSKKSVSDRVDADKRLQYGVVPRIWRYLFGISEPEGSRSSEKERRRRRRARAIMSVIVVLGIGGALEVPLFAAQAFFGCSLGACGWWKLLVPFACAPPACGWSGFLGTTVAGLLLAGAAMLAGGFLGFLFGIPRSLTERGAAEANAAPAGRTGKDTGRRRSGYGANTNLEQISDWLTKALIGATLTQIKEIIDLLKHIGERMGPALGGYDYSDEIAIVIVVHFTIGGFLVGYWWTRLVAASALDDAEREELEDELEKAAQQVIADKDAQDAVTLQLSDVEESKKPRQEELEKLFKAASKQALAAIFYQAEGHRYRNWDKAKDVMARSIPIFRALIARDVEGHYHRNHGQLGYALKDQEKPDWAAARDSLSTAIKIRGSADQNKHHGYEFNLALCEVHLDDAFEANQRSAEDRKERVMADLKVAFGDPEVRGWLDTNPKLKEWLALNGVDPKTL